MQLTASWLPPPKFLDVVESCHLELRMSSRSQLNKVMFDTNVTVLFVFVVQYMLKFFPKHW